MNCATSSALAPATTNTCPPIAADSSTSGGPRPCWPSCKPHDGTSPHVREHRLCLLARALTEPPVERCHWALTCRFAVGELAVLRIVGDEVRQHGHCDRCVDELAARAGVCRRMVQNAIRTAARLGLLTVEERRREGRRNLPNVVRVVSREWLAWLV